MQHMETCWKLWQWYFKKWLLWVAVICHAIVCYLLPCVFIRSSDAFSEKLQCRSPWEWKNGPSVSSANSWLWCLLSAAMEELDGDEVRVSSRGRFAERDIVQVRHFQQTNLLPSFGIDFKDVNQLDSGCLDLFYKLDIVHTSTLMCLMTF